MSTPSPGAWPLLGLLSLSCASALPRAPIAPHRPGDFVEVPYPPPAALVETVAPQPRDGAVWVNGYWDWSRGKYVWLRGGWVAPPEGYRHAPWISRYTTDGRILFARTEWFDGSGRKVPDPEFVVSAFTPPNYVTTESQTPR